MGPAGLNSGGGLDAAAVRELLDTLLNQKLAALPQMSQVASAGAGDVAKALALFDSSQCVQWDSMKNLAVLTLKPKMEVCLANGQLVGAVKQIDDSDPRHQIYMSISGQGSDRCYMGERCRWPLLQNNYYIYERYSDEAGGVALLRRAD
jgi:hypothetical protein